MRRGAPALVLAMFALAPRAQAQPVVDPFTKDQVPLLQLLAPGSTGSVTSDASILGTERDLFLQHFSGAGAVSAEVTTPSGPLAFSAGAGTLGQVRVTWDGADGDAGVLAATGLGVVNLTSGGANALRLRVLAATAGTSVTIQVYSSAANHSRRAVLLPAVAVQTDFYLAFSSLAISGGTGANFASVGAIEMTLRGTNVSATIDDLSAVAAASTMTGLLTDNVAVPAIPGQTLNYTATIANTGVGDATNLQLQAVLQTSVSLGTVEVSPLARDDAYSIGHDTQLTVIAPGVLANDVDAEPVPDPLTATPAGAIVTTQGGSVTLAGDGSFTYDPPAGFLGADSFNYQADDGNGIPGPGTVVIDVLCPVITVNPSALAEGLYNAAYSTVTFSATGAPTAVTWSATGLPPGITLGASSGDLTGTPTDTADPFTVVVTATDTAGCTGSRTISWIVRPNPDPESYTGGVGNTQFVVGATPPGTPHVFVSDNVKTGDQGPGTLSVTFNPTSANAGTIAEGTTDGTFVFSPALNFAGPSDSFTYTLMDGNGVTNTATVTIALSNRVWYVNSTGGSDSASRGRSHEPLLTIAQAVTNATSVVAGDTIFVHSSASNYAVAATLNDANLTLWGQGTAFALNGLSIAAGAKPTISNTITIAADNVTISSVAISTGGLTGVTNSGTRTGITIKNDVSVTTTTGTAVSFSNLNSTAGGAPNFGINFTSVSANGAANGISLTNVNVTTGTFTVLGDSGVTNNASGGLIQNTASAGVVLDNTRNVSLNYLDITNPGTDGIRITTINAFTLNRSNVSDSAGSAPADKAIDVGDFVTGTPVNGAISITNSVIGPAAGSSPHDSLAIGISGGTSVWNVTGTTIRRTGNSGINMEVRGSANATLNVTSSSFAGANVAGSGSPSARGIFVNNLDDSVVSTTIQTSSFTNNNIHIDLNQQNDTDPVGSHTFQVLNNATMTGARSHAMNIFAAAGTFAGTFTGTISGNTIGNAGIVDSGSAIGNGIRVNINGGSDATMLLDGNVIRQTPNGRGMEIIARNGTGGLDVTVTNNNVNPQDISGFPLAAILLQSNALTIANTIRADVRGNTVPSASDVTDLVTTYIGLVRSSTSTFQFVDTTAPISGTCASEVAATNTGSTSVLGTCTLIPPPISIP